MTLKPHVSVAETLDDLPDPHDDHDVPNHVPIRHTAETIAKLEDIDHGQARHPATARAWPDEPAYTVLGGHMAVAVHHHDPRRYTVREVARLQSFSDDFVFQGTKSEQYAKAGECVPPRLAAALGAHIRHQVEMGRSGELGSIEGPRWWVD